MIAMKEPDPPPSNDNDGCVFIGCLLPLAMLCLFIVIPIVDFVFRWWF